MTHIDKTLLKDEASRLKRLMITKTHPQEQMALATAALVLEGIADAIVDSDESQ